VGSNPTPAVSGEPPGSPEPPPLVRFADRRYAPGSNPTPAAHQAKDCDAFRIAVLPDHPNLIVASAVDTWATVAVAIGTIGTVVYALFRDLFVTVRRRPKLELLFDRSGNDQVVVGTAEGVDAACVRLRLANGKGKDTADDVVVMMTEIRRLEDSEQTIAETRPVALPLT
jgi:hypothetical protein